MISTLEQRAETQALVFYSKEFRFHVREDALGTDPSNGQQMIKTEVLKPVSRLGGITYARTTEGF